MRDEVSSRPGLVPFIAVEGTGRELGGTEVRPKEEEAQLWDLWGRKPRRSDPWCSHESKWQKLHGDKWPWELEGVEVPDELYSKLGVPKSQWNSKCKHFRWKCNPNGQDNGIPLVKNHAEGCEGCRKLYNRGGKPQEGPNSNRLESASRRPYVSQNQSLWGPYLTFPQQSALISTFPVLKSSPLLASTTGPILSFLLLLWLSLSRLGFTPCHTIFPLSVGGVEREDSVTGNKTNQFSYKLRKLDPLLNFYSVAV